MVKKMKKSYNKDALRGYDVDDKEWQAELAEIGIKLPENLLYSRKGPEWVMSHLRDTNTAGYIKAGDSEKLAKMKATENYVAAKRSYDDLLKMSSK